MAKIRLYSAELSRRGLLKGGRRRRRRRGRGGDAGYGFREKEEVAG